jgi:hypothetical protein
MPCYVSVGIGNGYYLLDIAQIEITENGRAHITFTPTNESLTYGNIFAFRAPRYNSVATYSATLKNIMLEVGSSPTTFAPYSNICPISGWDECKVTVADDLENPTTSNVYTIDLDGTRYGGKLDVVSGVLTIDRAMVDLGTLNWTLENGVFRLNQDIGAKKELNMNAIANIICSAYPTVSQVTMATTDKCVAGLNWSNGVRVSDSAYANVTDFKTAMNGVQLVYELATPQTIQLTPTIIKSLQGENNFFADSGEVIKLQYWGR